VKSFNTPYPGVWCFQAVNQRPKLTPPVSSPAIDLTRGKTGVITVETKAKVRRDFTGICNCNMHKEKPAFDGWFFCRMFN
jgi:hypothetical protein